MFRVLLEDDGVWKIAVPEISLGADALSYGRTLALQYGQPYRIEEYGGGLPESQEKKHYMMVVEPGDLKTILQGLGGRS